MQRLLIANRGEIAIPHCPGPLPIWALRASPFTPPEDAASLHRFQADRSVALEGRGAAAYLDIDDLVSLAIALGCAVHPGYGFLSENAQFAKKLEAAGLTFVGPSPEKNPCRPGQQVRSPRLGGAVRHPRAARAAMDRPRSKKPMSSSRLLDGAPLIIKAVSGGGGRGMRVVEDAKALEAAYQRCASEAELAFGDPALYVEEYLPHARQRRSADTRRRQRRSQPSLGGGSAAFSAAARSSWKSPLLRNSMATCAWRSPTQPCASAKRPTTAAPAPLSFW